MRAVLISIRPEWVNKILSGEKTLEIRKTRPNMGTSFKCYIYCTIDGIKKMPRDYITENFERGRVIGEFVCDKITCLTHIGCSGSPGIWLAAMKDRYTVDDSFDFSGSCLTTAQIEKYLDGEGGYAWHISKLKIYDDPKQLEDFRKYCDNDWYCESCAMYREHDGYCGNKSLQLRRPPQSWRYVRELEGEQ